MEWQVGERVRNNPKFAHVYEGTPWFEKMLKPREGTIIELPWAIQHSPTGSGTMLVKWDALVGDNSKADNWQRWMYSDFVRKLDATNPPKGDV